MVNLKKIGAIATGALFMGAALGTAAAVSFNSNMLVSGGVAKAKLVTGTANPDASGLAADEASAAIINDAVKAKFSTTAGGANVEFKYDSEDINDNSGDDVTADDGDVVKNSTSDDWDEEWMVSGLGNISDGSGEWANPYLNLSTNWNISSNNTANTEDYGVWFDATGDGEVDDADDYPVYNDIYIVDRTINDLTIKPAMRVGNAQYLVKKVFKLKGQKYYVKEYKDDSDQITLVPVDVKTLISADQTQDMLDAALLIPGTDIKIGLQGLSGPGTGNEYGDFAIIEGGVVTSYKHRANDTDPVFEIGTDQELLSDYYIIPTKIDVANNFVNLAIGKKTDEFKVNDGDTNVLGYATAVVNEDEERITNEFRLEDDEIQIAKDSSAQLANTFTYVKYDDKKKFDIVAKKVKSAASGSKLKSTKSPWKDFLKIDVTVSVTGGTSQAVSLATVKDTDVTSSDKSGYNLVLVGGPVANVLTADLVTGTKSTVDWYTSAGETEVVENAFSSGWYAIIVAGKDRAATNAAATALAAQI